MVKNWLKKHRKLCATFLTVAVILVALALNILLPYWQHTGVVYPDLTPEGLYTVSALMHKQMEEIQKQMDKTGKSVEVTFCAPRDVLLSNYETRYTYILAKKLEKDYPGVRVVMADASRPETLSDFLATKNAQIYWDQIVFSTETSSGGKQFRIIDAASFWSSEDDVVTNYNGEFKFASALLSLTAFEDAPLACFTKGHGEKYYDPEDPAHEDNAELEEFAQMLMDLGLRIRTVDLDEEEIPSDCVLLVMNGPREDYADAADHYADLGYVSAVEKIDRYLATYQAFMVLKDPDAGVLPVLNEYLEEWGLSFREGVIRDSSASGALTVATGDAANNREYLVASYATEENGSIGYEMYKVIADRATSPKTVLERCSPVEMTWGDGGSRVQYLNVTRKVSGVYYSSSNLDERGLPTAAAYVGESFSERDPSLSTAIPLAAISVEKKMGDEVDYYTASVFAVGTTKLISTEYMKNASFCNYDTMFCIIYTISGTDRYANAHLGGLTMNSNRYGGKALWLDELEQETVTNWYTDNDETYQFTYKAVTNTTRGVVTAVLAVLVVVIPVAGVAVHNRRKYR